MRDTAPKYVIDAIAALRAEREPLAAQLDALDNAVASLSRIWSVAEPTAPKKVAKAAKASKPRRVEAAAEDDSAAAERRRVLLSVISKSESGLCLAELRIATPKMDGADRSTALQALKSANQIRREGNAWVAVAA